MGGRTQPRCKQDFLLLSSAHLCSIEFKLGTGKTQLAQDGKKERAVKPVRLSITGGRTGQMGGILCDIADLHSGCHPNLPGMGDVFPEQQF